MATTIKDVARKAGVSTATVSLVLHNNNRISQPTRRRVLKAVQDLNYSPSHIARGLVMRQTYNIGFVLTDNHFLRTEPFYTHIFLGTEFAARDHNYYVLLNTISESFRTCDLLPRFILERNVDGIILAGKMPHSFVACLKSYQIPLVFVDYYPPDGDYSSVLIDNVDGGLKATEMCIRRGHRKIGFLGGDLKHPSIMDRLQGYKLALEKNGIPYDSSRVITSESNTDRAGGYHAMQELNRNGETVTAVFACNDAMAIGAMNFLKEAGFKIPGDISVIGFDDVTADLFTVPQLASIRVPKEDLGIEAMHLMMEVLKKRLIKPKKILVPVELIERQSVGSPPPA